MIQKIVEQRDEHLAVLDKEHDSAKKQVHTSAPINSALTCVSFVLVVLFGSLLFGFCFSIQVKGAKTFVWFPEGFSEFLKDPTACRLDLNAVKGFAIDEPYVTLIAKCRNEWLKVTNHAEPLLQVHTFGISVQTTGVFGSRYQNVASIG